VRSVPRRERGAALLAVLLLVAVMGAIAASALEKLRYSTALATNGAALDQARAYAVGLETLLAVRVDDLLARSPGVTTLAGGWNRQRRKVELLGDGEAEGMIGDGGNCFNVNSVADGSDPLTLAPRPAGIDQFAALMVLLGLGEPEARRIAESAADWVDSDRAMHARGAEDSAYASAAPAYRPGNTLFAEVSELRAVAGVTPEIYARLRPFLCALPMAELSPINVNTLLPDQAPLLAMLSPGRISLNSARAAIAQRPAGGWESKGAFWSSRALSGATPPLDASDQIQLSTRWFSLELRIRFGGAELIETALIDARLRPSRVAVRRWGAED
jgi:general secretion pathway protein K